MTDEDSERSVGKKGDKKWKNFRLDAFLAQEIARHDVKFPKIAKVHRHFFQYTVNYDDNVRLLERYGVG